MNIDLTAVTVMLVRIWPHPSLNSQVNKEKAFFPYGSFQTDVLAGNEMESAFSYSINSEIGKDRIMFSGLQRERRKVGVGEETQCCKELVLL